MPLAGAEQLLGGDWGLGKWKIGRARGSWVAGVGELDLAAVGFEAEGQGALPAGGGVFPAAEGGVGGGLFLDAFEGMVGALGLEDAAGFAVEVEDVVGAAALDSGIAGGLSRGRWELEPMAEPGGSDGASPRRRAGRRWNRGRWLREWALLEIRAMLGDLGPEGSRNAGEWGQVDRE
jgi:hypothetical protein